MSGAIVQQPVTVTSPQGLHLRPLTAFAQKAATFGCEVKVTRDGRSVDGKSAWEMMSMISMPGAVLTIQAVGFMRASMRANRACFGAASSTMASQIQSQPESHSRC